MKIIPGIFAAIILFLPTITQAQTLREQINTIASNHDMMGGALVVFCGNDILENIAFGKSDYARNMDVSVQTKFRIASISKTITAIAIMQLVDQKLLNLDADIGDILGYKVRNPNYPDAPITARMLLSHTSSLTDGATYSTFLSATVGNNPIPNLKELLVPGGTYYVDSQFNNKKPGQYFTYANVNYVILGTLLEKVTNTRFDMYCRQHILLPLGLDASFNVNDLSDLNELAVLYRKQNGVWTPQTDNFQGIQPVFDNVIHYVPGTNGGRFGPQGGLRCSAQDLAAIFLCLMNGRKDGASILSETARNAMLAETWAFNGDNGDNYNGLFRSWGLGIHRITSTPNNDVALPKSTQMFGHAGDAYGLVSNAYFDTTRHVGFVFITNGVGSGYNNGNTSAFYSVEEAVCRAIDNSAPLEDCKLFATTSLQQQQLHEVSVQGYLSQQPLLQTPASVGIIHAEQLQRYSAASLLPAFNLLPGVRMEERSPGSYRLSIRGSLLRSPFGVRNVKVYLDEFPLTDAGGNTYLNLIDARAIERVEVLKGPDGSLFGANSGGVVLLELNGQKKDSSGLTLGLSGGSYGLLHEHASLKYTSGKSRFSFNQAYQQSDGYRQNSALQRAFFQAAERWTYGKNNSLKLLAMYTDLHYQTPGGLTQAQFDADPRQARPAAGPNPGAAEQQAGVYNQTFFGGIANELYLTDRLVYVASVFGSHTDFKNPFITNYETRNEQNLGVRTYFGWNGKENAALRWKWNLGLEGQKGRQDITNYANNRGTKGAQLAQDELNIAQIFYFSRWSATFRERLSAECALSLNTYRYGYQSATSDSSITLARQWMPRAAISYLLRRGLALRATLSRGYSPPTLAEIRPSNNVINTDLQAESGWNKEVGLRLNAWKDRLQGDVSVFRYDLTNAIVRRTDAAGAEYFVNAGGTRQTGLEAFLSAWLMAPRTNGFVRGLQTSGSLTYSHFLFSDYRDATTDYSGKHLTGVPQSVLVWSMLLRFPQDLSLFAEFNATSRLPLNDGNTAYAGKYHLLQARLEWSKWRIKKAGLILSVGVENMLNERYSLGNDINAFGGRYFNAAAGRNFWLRLQIHLSK